MEWRKIQGYVGHSGADTWEVSDILTVRQNGIEVKPKIDSQGYLYVHLCRGGTLVRVHQLYLYTFVGPPPEDFVAIRDKDTWKWGPRDMVKLTRHKPKKEKPPRKRTARRGKASREHFDEWLANYIRLERT